VSEPMRLGIDPLVSAGVNNEAKRPRSGSDPFGSDPIGSDPIGSDPIGSDPIWPEPDSAFGKLRSLEAECWRKGNPTPIAW